jgi:hypothetical protein
MLHSSSALVTLPFSALGESSPTQQASVVDLSLPILDFAIQPDGDVLVVLDTTRAGGETADSAAARLFTVKDGQLSLVRPEAPTVKTLNSEASVEGENGKLTMT